MKKADEPKQIRGREELQGRMKNSSEGRWRQIWKSLDSKWGKEKEIGKGW
mgnify:CR=1 FL=1